MTVSLCQAEKRKTRRSEVSAQAIWILCSDTWQKRNRELQVSSYWSVRHRHPKIPTPHPTSGKAEARQTSLRSPVQKTPLTLHAVGQQPVFTELTVGAAGQIRDDVRCMLWD